jgi:peroxiredoxin/predicted 2-oxoglutarate/Fe(II)-dependent dioxygenase YbiX
MNSYVNLRVGDPAPWFIQRSASSPRYAFDTAAGRYIVLCFYGTASDACSRAVLKSVVARRAIFDDEKACFFGISLDKSDERQNRVKDRFPGLRFIWDFDGSASKLYGVLAKGAEPEQGKVAIRRLWFVLDPTLRILKVLAFADDGSCVDEILRFLDSLPPPSQFAGFEVHAPILVLPNVFEPDLCRRLIELYEADGGQESGFMTDVGGKTVVIHDYGHKRRRDYNIEDPRLQETLQGRLVRRVVPEILKVHQFNATRMERYVVACYRAEDEGHFMAHRDNTTKGTAHRRFAVSINLNAKFEGGELSFPEYGPRSLKPPPGGAVVFSCSLLHAVSKVTSGKRYAFLPFLYDEAAAKVRAENNAFVEGGRYYKAGVPPEAAG